MRSIRGQDRGSQVIRVLGVDPGLTRCGVGVVEGAPGQQLRCLRVGVIRTAPDLPFDQRLLVVADALAEAVAAVQPDLVAVERVFAQHNVRTVMGTAQAAGFAVVAAARAGIPVALHTPSEVKAAITGSGRADKAQVTTMVTRLLQLDEAPRPADAADALALAICAIWRGSADRRRQDALLADRRGQDAVLADRRGHVSGHTMTTTAMTTGRPA